MQHPEVQVNILAVSIVDELKQKLKYCNTFCLSDEYAAVESLFVQY